MDQTGNNNQDSPSPKNVSHENRTPAPKRGRNEFEKSIFDNACKTPRISNFNSPFRLVQLLDSRFKKFWDSLTTLMKTLIQESESRILEKIDKMENSMCEMKSDLIKVTERVSKLETVSDELAAMKSEIRELIMQNLRQENSLVACDLRINGIPFFENEDLLAIFDDICYTLNIPTPSVKAIYRLQNRNNKNKSNSPDAVIIAKLMSPYDKNVMLKSIAAFRKANRCPLMLKHIGYKSKSTDRYKSDDPFFIYENLTSNNYHIFVSALRLKKNNHLQSVFTLRGLVYVKNSSTDKPVRIDDVEQLNEFFLPSGNMSYNNDDI